MKRLPACARVGAFCALYFWFSAADVFAQWDAQTLALTNGQNAVFITVSPPEKLDTLFAGTGISRVQCFNPVVSSQFEVSPNEPLPRNAEWLYWSRDGLAENTMARLYAGKGYIIEADAPVTLTVTGKVTEMRQNWQAGEYNLTGFEVDGKAVQFNDYLAAVKDKVTVEQLRAGVSNVWDVVDIDGSDTIQPGESYFVRPSKPMDYAGPIELSGGLYFTQPNDAAVLTVTFHGDVFTNVIVSIDDSLSAPTGQTAIAGPVKLKVWQEGGGVCVCGCDQ